MSIRSISSRISATNLVLEFVLLMSGYGNTNELGQASTKHCEAETPLFLGLFLLSYSCLFWQKIAYET